jgi:hypothetical protein
MCFTLAYQLLTECFINSHFLIIRNGSVFRIILLELNVLSSAEVQAVFCSFLDCMLQGSEMNQRNLYDTRY